MFQVCPYTSHEQWLCSSSLDGEDWLTTIVMASLGCSQVLVLRSIFGEHFGISAIGVSVTFTHSGYQPLMGSGSLDARNSLARAKTPGWFRALHYSTETLPCFLTKRSSVHSFICAAKFNKQEHQFHRNQLDSVHPIFFERIIDWRKKGFSQDIIS